MSKEKKHIVQTLSWGVRQPGQADYLGFIWRMSLVSKGINQSSKKQALLQFSSVARKRAIFQKSEYLSSHALLHLLVSSCIIIWLPAKPLTLLQVHSAGPLNNSNNKSTFS